MSHEFPIAELAEALVSRFQTRASSFPSPLKLVDFDQFWKESMTPDDFKNRLSALIFEINPSTFLHENKSVNQEWNLSANYLYQIKGRDRISDLASAQKVLSFLTSGEQFDDIPEIYTAIGSRFYGCKVSGFNPDNTFLDLKIGVFKIDFSLSVLSK